MIQKFFFICLCIFFVGCDSHKDLEFFDRRPDNFKAFKTVSVCFIENSEGFVFLQNNSKAKMGAKQWTLYHHEMDNGSAPRGYMHKRLAQDLNLSLAYSTLKPLTTLYIRNSKHDYIYHLFYARTQDAATLNKESAFEAMKTMSFEKAQDLDLAPGVTDLIDAYERHRRSFVE